MIKALIIGCGNIGALYDLETEALATYAKAFYRAGDIAFSVYDPKPAVARRMAQRYGVPCLSRWDEVPPGSLDLVVISAPTSTHAAYLEALWKAPPRLIICEKPVDTDLARLDRLEERYRASGARVLVNFHRRFQPRIADLRDRVQARAAQEPCIQVVVKYQRGFHNNASHAMDLLAFLFGKRFEPTDFRIGQAVFDEFPADPTLSAHCRWGGTSVQFTGLAGARFSHFEIELYFPTQAVFLRKGSDEVEFLSTPARQGAFHPALRSDEVWSGVLQNHMAAVVAQARRMLADPSMPDNFLEGTKISRNIVQITRELHP